MSSPVEEPSAAQPVSSVKAPHVDTTSEQEAVEAPPVAPYGHVYSVRYITWIWAERPSNPRGKLLKHGAIRVGYGVPLRSEERRPGQPGCRRGYFAVAPYGWVCDDQTTTRDPEHPVVRAVTETHSVPDDAIYPYEYAFSIGAPMYDRIPTEEQHRRVMMRYRERPLKLGDWARGFEDLVEEAPITENGPAPTFVTEGAQSPLGGGGLLRKSLPHGSMVSYGRAFHAAGRVWLVTPELALVPADRVRRYRPSAFRGVRLEGPSAPKLPLGWARLTPRPLHRLEEGGLVPTGEVAEPGAPLELDTEERRHAGHRYLRTRRGDWVRRDHFRVAKLVKAPASVGDGTWVYLSLLENTLVAYRGEEPVYATVHAPGRGGAHHGKGSVKNYTTPLGAFPVNWKERWGTMSPDPGAPTSFWISDVMWTQYFKQPYALHGAYWHERFGEKMSAGCPNLSPLDARWLFEFTEPPLPPGWQAIAPLPGTPATLVVLGS
ncbi:MAG: L,D-transpeptidase [Polyangiaceae bacterium]|nr:L,D-transpeptidase [Polyangiaceae bacterium]MCW5790096.1 L,D-transpeptidase [Polyangiaceae bacterium]